MCVRRVAGVLRRPGGRPSPRPLKRSEEHTSELQSQSNLVCRLLLEKKKQTDIGPYDIVRIDISHHNTISVTHLRKVLVTIPRAHLPAQAQHQRSALQLDAEACVSSV